MMRSMMRGVVPGLFLMGASAGCFAECAQDDADCLARERAAAQAALDQQAAEQQAQQQAAEQQAQQQAGGVQRAKRPKKGGG